MIFKLNDHLYTIKVRLAGSPLRDLNCYVIRTPERNLLIDTGFNRSECLEDLRLGIQELGLDMNDTDILATHFHSDHCGLIDKIAAPGSRVYMSGTDKVLYEAGFDSDILWRRKKLLYQQEGFPAGVLEKAAGDNPARAFAPGRPVALTPLEDGRSLVIGGIRLQCIHTPGHTPGHMCLYNEQDRSMILGDHVLFDITPNITTWLSMPNSLEMYLNSLKMIRKYNVSLPLPAHRACHCGMVQRIDQLLLHHEKRLAEAETIIRENPGISGYDIAGKMRWSIRVKSWEDFPPAQKWFAVGEALSHIYHLVQNGKVRSESRDGVMAYRA